MFEKMSRRQWLTSTAAGLAVPYWFTASRSQAETSKNDRPIAAVIGAGGRGTSMGWHQFGHFADLVAICDVDLREAERAAATIEAKIGIRPKIYQDYRKLLERNDIEVIGNATPDHWHTRINIDACRAGKDVYAEKPLTFTIDEGKLLRDVVHETGPRAPSRFPAAERGRVPHGLRIGPQRTDRTVAPCGRAAAL